MIRKIIKIDEDKCNGCGACATACHEGAIDMVNGKAKLTREHYCDGLGDCLPACPTGAITFEEREAPAYDEQAVSQAKLTQRNHHANCSNGFTCPGMAQKTLKGESSDLAPRASNVKNELMQWPCQIKLVPTSAPYFENANLLIAADCCAYAYGNFHAEFMKNHVTLIGCPKLDGVDYAQKLTQIIANNNVKSVKVVRMEVPCCGGLERAVKQALMDSNKFIPWQIITLSTDGKIINE